MRAGLVTAGALGAAAVLAGCGDGLFGGGADPRDFTTVDLNGDDTIEREEFARWGREQGLLASFMGEGEKAVSETALATGLYELWNLEGADLTEAEWNEGMRTWFPDVEGAAYTSWDLDQDNVLDEQEMIAGLAHADLLAGFDEDGNGQIAANELLSRFYQVFDVDRDERLSMNEWTSGLGRWSWPI